MAQGAITFRLKHIKKCYKKGKKMENIRSSVFCVYSNQIIDKRDQINCLSLRLLLIQTFGSL